MDPQQPMPQMSGGAKPEQKTLMGILAYLGILIIIPFLMAKNDPFVKFHIKQGLLLVIAEVIVWVLNMTMLGWQLWGLLSLINLVCLVYSIIGIVNVVQGTQKELPFIGGLAKSFTF